MREGSVMYWPPSSTLIFHPSPNIWRKTLVFRHGHFVFWTFLNLYFGVKRWSHRLQLQPRRHWADQKICHCFWQNSTPVELSDFSAPSSKIERLRPFLSSWPLEGTTSFFCRGPTKSKNMTSSSHLLFYLSTIFQGENCALTALCYVTYVKKRTIIKIIMHRDSSKPYTALWRCIILTNIVIGVFSPPFAGHKN